MLLGVRDGLLDHVPRVQQADVDQRAEHRVEQPRLVCGDRVLVGPEQREPLVEEAGQPALGLPVRGGPVVAGQVARVVGELLAHPGDRVLHVVGAGGPWLRGDLDVLREPPAVLGVVAPPAADRPVAVHQQVQAAPLALVEGLHPRLPHPVERLRDLVTRGEEARRLQHLEGHLLPAADPAQVAVEPVVDHVVHAHRAHVVLVEDAGQQLVGARPRRRRDVHDREAVLAQRVGERAHRRAVQHQLVGVEGELPEEQVRLDEHHQRAVCRVEVLHEQLVRENQAGGRHTGHCSPWFHVQPRLGT